MSQIIRLTESDLTRIIRRVIHQQKLNESMLNEDLDSTIMLSLGKKIYQDLKNKGVEVVSWHRVDPGKRAILKANIKTTSLQDRTQVYVHAEERYIEVSYNINKYESEYTEEKLNEIFEELKNKYEDEDIRAFIDTSGDKAELIFTFRDSGDFRNLDSENIRHNDNYKKTRAQFFSRTD